ncbi:MAG TPA: hypothetical protein VFC53_09615 [Dehalococcoidia bacterium]|nr:hypothetical protein [Dehalococcoidia bacterium]
MERFTPRMLAYLAAAFVLGVIATAVAAALGSTPLRIVVDALAAAAMIGVSVRVMTEAAPEPQIPPAVPTVISAIRGDHRRPIFDRATGLLADWYFRLRAEEEIARATRYEQPLTVLRIDGAPDDIAPAVRNAIRAVDLPGVCGDFVAILLPNTSPEGAKAVADRLLAGAPELKITGSRYPDDGETLAALVGEPQWAGIEDPREDREQTDAA